MTRRQIRKLEAIIGRLEALQNEVITPERYRLGDAKSELLRALSEAERSQ